MICALPITGRVFILFLAKFQKALGFSIILAIFSQIDCGGYK